MPRHTDSRARALATAEHLFRTQGYAATGLAQIIAESGSPKGSFYFHFPGGKAQLAAEALAVYAGRVDALLRRLSAAHSGDAGGFVAALFAAVAAEMAGAGFRLSCLVQILANEQPAGEAASGKPLAAASTSWIGLIAAHLEGCGMTSAVAREAAIAIVTLLQGARGLARIEHSPQPFAVAARLAGEVLRLPVSLPPEPVSAQA
ncbi:hypothetical protein CHU93_00310 [Sandarakinorhabdus cyanobacteriorum]|uniref:HTH tetR-type domain-containing protein n=1 Tax=Sandarakinorhabdus cyanobacteriorum TaxID=1981098 RepID=A0A255Z8U4_9SPHN|nr:TetR/AcrR family transcriptional regulator [Sandarakinorhabdus cyanobacteriorum]OYQ37876.1 hypothetical protein CHU93_00310 [Sandarakinorhabdus cyanobacteriorum]